MIMSSSLSVPLSYPIALSLVVQLASWLQAQAGDAGLWRSNIQPMAPHLPSQAVGHVALLSQAFSVLVLAQPVDDRYQLRLSFVPTEILAFVQSLPEHAGISAVELPAIGLNDALRQTEFTMYLLNLLQAQTSDLEEMVNQRTQALRDALVAAKAADRAKSEFLATMSHELRTPLTCIIGMSSTLLRQDAPEILPLPRQRQHLQIIHDRGENLLTMINDILELSNIESGQTVLNIRKFALSQLASQVLKEFESKAQQKKIQLSIDSYPETGSGNYFQADPQQLRQILINLLSNSIKFTPEAGKVVLKIRINEGRATIHVEDTGIGIPESQQHLIFQKFQQLDSSLQRRYEGTGLGLALTKQLVELHGGTITFTSNPRQGTTFTVTLPEQTMPAIDLNRENTKRTIYPRILLVDHIEEQANFICDLLTAADYHVIWMTDIETAVYQLEATQPILAIVNTDLLTTPAISQQLKNALERSPIHLLLIAPGVVNQQQYDELNPDGFIASGVEQPEQWVDRVTQLMTKI
jgi:two-component system, sensor histidine kinase and response regulator